ncbi:ABC transporter substrate-binding protein [Bosea sp. AS-1]|uniref:ABC transporter substrate-binding protein n=1 Tax=Bosea sp. AS-1 TaxID=2015316 RepID=UPI001AEC9E10|nr:ABC transporter substrate-binding protein [Bosea sp. AS-1]
MRITRVAAGLALAASLMTSFAARAEEPGITDKTIKIGIFGPLSGPNMAYGFDVVNAAKMYYDKINKEGGIHGRKIEYVVEDDRCNANDLVAAVKKLVEQDQVFMLNGGSCSAAVVAAKDYVVRNKVPYLMLNASGDGALFPPTDYIFGAYSISQYAVGGAMIEFAAKQFGAKTVAYINHDDAYGAWNLEGSKKDAEVNGVKLVVESVNPSINDVTAPFLKVRAANPDAILLVTYARPAALLIKKAQEMGFNKPIILSVTGTASLNQLAENVGKDALKNFYTQEVMVDSPGGAKLKPIYDMYKAAYPDLAAKPDHPQTYMPYGIPPAMSLVKALQDAGPNPTREKVLAALKTQDFDSGVMAGRMQFGPEQRAANRSTIFIKYDGNTMTPLPGVFTSRWTYQAK